MTIEITQDEMNILNLNGISEDDVRGNIEFHRAAGMDDKAIRQQFTNTINELKPLTRQSAADTANIQEWKNKGPITPFEAAQRNSVTFNGTYNNVIKKEETRQPSEMNAMGKAITSLLDNAAKPLKDAAPDFIKDGLMQFGNALNEIGKKAYEAQINYAQQEDDNQMPHKGDSNYKYTPVGMDRAGKVLYQETDLRKPIGFAESMTNNGLLNGSWVPFAGGFIKSEADKKQREIQEKILKNEPIREDELKFLNYRLDKQQEEQVRGYTLGGEIARGFLPSLIRFGTEMAVGGWLLKSLGWAAELKEGASIGQKIIHGFGEMGKTGLVNTITPIGWNDIYETYQGRMLNNEIKFTDKGEWIFQNSEEKPATAFMKSLGQTFIMFASEASGELLHIPVKGVTAAATKYVGTPISKYVMSNKTLSEFVKKATPEFAKLYEKMNDLPIEGRNIDWLKSKVKFDGFFEELGEEVIEDVLNLTIGTNDEERSLENYAKAIFKSPDEWAVLAGAIALQGGTLSVASHILGSHLERNGATDEQILDVLNNLSENDKEQMVENLIQDGVINIAETDEEHFEKSVKSVADNLIQTGQFSDRTKAEQAARLGTTMLQNLSEKTGLSAYDLIRDEMAEIAESDEDVYVDENGILHAGISYNENPSIAIDNQIDELSKEFISLPDNFSNADYINNILDKISTLLAIKDNELSIDDMEKANNLIAEYEQNGETIFANQLKEYLNNPKIYNQTGNNKIDNSTAYKKLSKDLKEAIDFIYKGNPVYNITGEEFPKNGENFNKRIINFYKENFNNKITIAALGEIKLDNRSVKDSIYHGTNENKMNAFAAVPYVIQYGKMLDVTKDNGKKEKRYLFVAPVTLKGQNYYCEVIVKSNKDRQGFYIHEVELMEKLTDVFSTAHHGTSISSKSIIADLVNNLNPIRYNQGTFDADNPNMYYQEDYADPNEYFNNPEIAKAEAKLEKDIEAHLKGNMHPRAKINFGKAPLILQDFGVPDKIMLMPQHKYDCSTGRKRVKGSIHHISDDVMKKLPSLLADPIMIAYPLSTATKQDNRIIAAVNKVDDNGDTICVIIDYDWQGNKVNIIPSAYGREDFDDFVKACDNENKIVYVDEKNLLSHISKRSSFRGNSKGSNNSITYKKDKFKPVSYNQETFDADNPNIYYQTNYNPLSFDKLQRKDGRYVDIEYYDNSDVKSVKPLNIRELKYENKDVKDITKAKLKKDILNNKKSIKIKNSKSGINAALKASSVDEMFADIFKDKGYEYLRKEIISNIETIFENAIPVLKHPELKNENLYDTQIVHRFALPVKIGGNNFLTMVTVKERTDSKERQIDEFAIYNLTSKNERELGSSSQGANAATSHNQTLNYSINDLSKFIKGNIEKYTEPTQYETLNQTKLFIDNEKAEQITNRFTKIKGSFIPAENLIRLFKDADESTIVHEFAHWWLEKLQKYAQDNEEIQQDLAEIRKFVKNNGEAFTDEQHERFARGFEAYMRTGSAKTNRLKKLFEDFKNALLSLYDSIKSLGFDEDEIPEINNLFDRLLTTENQRVQAAVFDKVNEIQNQIEAIKEKQNSELADIDNIYNGNIERDAQDARRKAQVQEYLRLANKATDRVPKAVKEYSKRYRQACYEILHAALNGKYSIKYIQMTLGQNNKKSEQLREELLEVADNIIASGGMRENWKEFFTNNDTDEIDSDYNLVEQALNAIESNNFLQPEQYEGEQVIGKFFGTFDYLANKVLTLKGENKDAAYEALTSIFDKIPSMPDGAMEDIAVKLEEVSNSFVEQKTKENLSKWGRVGSIRNVSLAVQLRTYVTNKLHEMKSYDPVEKRYVRLSSVNRLYSLLRYATDTTSTKEIIRQINNHAIAQLENRQKGILHKEIQKQIKTNSKLIKVGALKQGKFDWKTNTVFAELADMNRLNIEDAQKEYLRLTHADEIELGESRDSYDENPTTTLDAPTDFQKILKVKFLEYRANKIKNLNVTATRSLLEDIIELKFEGRRAKNEQDLKKALSRYNYENNLIQIINKNKSNDKAKYIARWVAGDTAFTSEGTLANWESLLNAIFDKNTAKEYSLLKLESDAEVYAHRKLAEFYNKAIDIYKLRRKNQDVASKAKNIFEKIIDFENIQPLVNLFREYEQETYTYKQDTWNKDTNKVITTEIELTRSQIITLYTWSLNPELRKRLVTQFGGVDMMLDDKPLGEARLEEMFSKLSDEDKQFAWLLIDTCDSMYEDTNEIFIRTTGLSLQRVDNYFPSKTERVGSDIDMLHEFVVRSTNPSFIKSRKNCGRIKMDAQSPLEILLPHINKTARYVVLSERVNFLNRIFASNDIQAALIDAYGKKSGKKLHQVLLNQLATSTYTNYAKSVTVGKTLMDNVASNYISSRIGGNLKVMLSQLTSVINYAENMPAKVWAAGFADAIKHPKETIKFMMDNCEYLKTRLASNSMNEVMSKLTDETDKLRSLRNFCATNTKYGDILAIMFGGKPYVDYLIESGMTKGEAFTKFVEDTLRSQQSGHNSATSAWQKKQAETPFTRMIFAFNNTNLQYERKWVDAISNYVKGDSTKQEFAKAFIIYKVFNPILFTSFLTNLSIFSLIRGIAGGDDDLFGFGSDIAASILLSNLKGYGMLGILANALGSIVFASLNKDRYLSQDLPLITDFEETAQKLLTKDDLSFEDYIKMLCIVGDYSSGVPLTRLENAVGGFGDIAGGQTGAGLLRMIGYGRYRAYQATTGKAPQ